jgi:16S rRNA (uracil1498-N3)-methyltransferase
MRIPRIYTNQTLTPGGEIDLESEAARHLVQVLRFRCGSMLTLFNGDGFDYNAELLIADKRKCRIKIRLRGEPEPPLPLNIELAIGISKGERMDFAVQKAVELGISCISLLLTERSVVRLSALRLEKRMDHWQKIVIGACEQSGRKRIPEIRTVGRLENWFATTSRKNIGLVLDHRAESTLASLKHPISQQAISLLVGPEGGLTEDEVVAATKLGFIPIRLGPRILRTETAPLAAVSAIQTLWGDFR